MVVVKIIPDEQITAKSPALDAAATPLPAPLQSSTQHLFIVCAADELHLSLDVGRLLVNQLVMGTSYSSGVDEVVKVGVTAAVEMAQDSEMTNRKRKGVLIH